VYRVYKGNVYNLIMLKIEFISLLNLRFLITGLTPFGHLIYIILTPCFLLECHFGFAPTFPTPGKQLGRKTGTGCGHLSRLLFDLA